MLYDTFMYEWICKPSFVHIFDPCLCAVPCKYLFASSSNTRAHAAAHCFAHASASELVVVWPRIVPSHASQTSLRQSTSEVYAIVGQYWHFCALSLQTPQPTRQPTPQPVGSQSAFYTAPNKQGVATHQSCSKLHDTVSQYWLAAFADPPALTCTYTCWSSGSVQRRLHLVHVPAKLIIRSYWMLQWWSQYKHRRCSFRLQFLLLLSCKWC